MATKATKAALRDALREMIEAAEVVVASWEKGDLASAVSNLDATVDAMREVLGEPAVDCPATDGFGCRCGQHGETA